MCNKLFCVQESGPTPALAGSDLVVGEDYNRQHIQWSPCSNN
jgi:hypothetical protein